MDEDDRGLLDRPIPAAVLQLIGMALLLVAVGVIYDGWYVVAALGIALTFGRNDELHEALRLMRGIARRRASTDDDEPRPLR